MSLENENNSENPVSETEKPVSGKNKGGRPKGSKDKNSRRKGGRPRESGIALRQQRKYEVSLQEAFRQGVHPEVMLEYYKTILRGQNPILDTRDGVDYVIPDPNPLLPAPTLEQRNAAMKALADRGYGLPSQSIQIDAEFRNKVELQLTGISEDQLGAMNMQKLVQLREMFKLPAPKDEIEAEDAEIIEFSPATESSSEV